MAITNEQIRTLRSEAMAAGDYRQVDVCDVALAPLESANTDGTPLVDSDGNPTTRTEARAECERVIAPQTARKLARELYSDDLSREPEVPIQRDGGKAYDAWLGSASDGCDTDTRDALMAVDRADFAAAWETIVADGDQ